MSTEVLNQNFLTAAVKSHFQAKLRDKLQEVSKETINEVVEELSQTLQTSLQTYVDIQFYEKVVKVIVEDRRK